MREKVLLFLAAILGGFSLSLPVFAAPGDLDTTFSGDGKLAHSLGSAADLVIQSNEMITVAGKSEVCDPTCSDHLTLMHSGPTGITFTNPLGPANSEASSVILMPGDKLIAGGRAGGDFALIGPGSFGLVTTSFNGVNDAIADLALQPDGRIVAVGSTYVGPGAEGDDYDFALARYLSNGSLDESFGTGGKVVINFGEALFYNEKAAAVAILPDGKVIVAGTVGDNSSFQSFALVRFNPDGSLDTDFGNGDGLVMTSVRGFDESRDVVIQEDGKIIVAGTSRVSNTPGFGGDFSLVRYHPDGSVDNTFGNGGIVTTDFGGANDEAMSLAVQSDGKIVVGGGSTGYRCWGVCPLIFIGTSDFAIVRYNANGSLDPDFGTGGMVFTDFDSLSDDDLAAVAIQEDGKIVAAGTHTAEDGRKLFALARYLGDPTRVSLTAYASPAEGGTFEFDPPPGEAVPCPAAIGVVCPVLYEKDSAVTITAIPFAGYRFHSWFLECYGQFNPCEIIMNTNKEVVAFFELLPVTTSSTTTSTTSTTSTSSTTPVTSTSTTVIANFSEEDDKLDVLSCSFSPQTGPRPSKTLSFLLLLFMPLAMVRIRRFLCRS